MTQPTPAGEVGREHYSVWRFRSSVDGEASEEVEVCAVCSPKHTPEELWVLWPCPFASDLGRS